MSDIKSRIKGGQIRVNGVQVFEDTEIPFAGGIMEAGEFIFAFISDNLERQITTLLIGFENLPTCTTTNTEFTRLMKNFTIIRMSKKEMIVVGSK